MPCPRGLFLCFLSKTRSICFYYCCSFPVILIDWQSERTHPAPQRRANKGTSVTRSLALIWRKGNWNNTQLLAGLKGIASNRLAPGGLDDPTLQSLTLALKHTRTHIQNFHPDIFLTIFHTHLTLLPHADAKKKKKLLLFSYILSLRVIM